MRTKYLHVAVMAALALCAVQANAAETTTTTTTSASTTVSTTSADAAYLKRIEGGYTDFAGSSSNLQSLASGLRHGSTVTLTDATGAPSTTFTPPTKPMGYGNITRALDFANRDLAAAGITNPTPEQVSAALMGGTVTNAQGQVITMDGVLQLRSQGMGWGQIAHQLNISPAANVHGQNATLVNAAGTSGKVSGNHSGIVNADGSSSSGLTTASGKTVNAGGTKSNAGGHSGIVSADGGAAGSVSSGGNAYGHAKSGIVSAGGTGAGYAGITTGGGGGYNGGAAAASSHSALGGGGNGNAYGQAKGKN
jgi:hypothetical protein